MACEACQSKNPRRVRMGEAHRADAGEIHGGAGPERKQAKPVKYEPAGPLPNDSTV